jgi:hypothetical protein
MMKASAKEKLLGIDQLTLKKVLALKGSSRLQQV